MDKKTQEKALQALARQEKQYKRQNDYIKNTFDRVSVTLPKGTKEKIVAFNEFPYKKVPYWGKVSPEECEYDSNIYTLSVKCAEDFIDKNKNSQSEDKQLQIAFLNYLLFIVNNTDPSKYTYSTKIISVLQQNLFKSKSCYCFSYAT